MPCGQSQGAKRDSNPNCGAAREREKKSRARERTFPQKALTQGTAGPLAEQSTGRIPEES